MLYFKHPLHGSQQFFNNIIKYGLQQDKKTCQLTCVNFLVQHFGKIIGLDLAPVSEKVENHCSVHYTCWKLSLIWNLFSLCWSKICINTINTVIVNRKAFCVDAAWSTFGPQTTYDPPNCLIWPTELAQIASHQLIFFISFILLCTYNQFICSQTGLQSNFRMQCCLRVGKTATSELKHWIQ